MPQMRHAPGKKKSGLETPKSDKIHYDGNEGETHFPPPPSKKQSVWHWRALDVGMNFYELSLYFHPKAPNHLLNPLQPWPLFFCFFCFRFKDEVKCFGMQVWVYHYFLHTYRTGLYWIFTTLVGTLGEFRDGFRCSVRHADMLDPEIGYVDLDFPLVGWLNETQFGYMYLWWEIL